MDLYLKPPKVSKAVKAKLPKAQQFGCHKCLYEGKTTNAYNKHMKDCHRLVPGKDEYQPPRVVPGIPAETPAKKPISSSTAKAPKAPIKSRKRPATSLPSKRQKLKETKLAAVDQVPTAAVDQVPTAAAGTSIASITPVTACTPIACTIPIACITSSIPLNEYEEARQAKIATNNGILASLSLPSSLLPKKPSKPAKKPAKPPTAPSRRSTRAKAEVVSYAETGNFNDDVREDDSNDDSKEHNEQHEQFKAGATVYVRDRPTDPNVATPTVTEGKVVCRKLGSETTFSVGFSAKKFYWYPAADIFNSREEALASSWE